jgi:hypothetical protein
MNRSFGLNWPDTWIVYHGQAKSTLSRHKIIQEELSSDEMTVQFYPGQAYPQPSYIQDERCLLIFDGHIYNTGELLKGLHEQDQNKPNDPASLLLTAYYTFGEFFYQKISGIFALILWDRQEELFLAVRDPVGVYPLFYSETPHGRFFSISIQALLALPEVSKTISRTVLALYLSLSWGHKEETVYESIKRVPAGHLLRIHHTQATPMRYWNLISPNGDVDWIQDASDEQFEQLLSKISQDFHSFGSLGIYLSGGLDSVTAAAYLSETAKITGRPVPRAYSLVFPNIGEIELPVQKGVAAGLKLPLFITSLQEASGAQGLLMSAFQSNLSWPVPMQNFWRPAYNCLGNRAYQEGCSAIITGVGGDEWLGLNPYYAADLLGQLDFIGLYRLIISMWRSWPFPLYKHIYNGVWKYGARPLLARQVAGVLFQAAPGILRRRRKKSLQLVHPNWFCPDDELEKEISLRMEERVEESIQADRIKSFYIREMEYSIDHPLNSLDLEEEFENGRRLGTPILGFYQHQELVSYLFRFPPRLLNTSEPQKGLVRKLLHKRFPHLNLDKQKKIGATDNFREIVLSESPEVWKKLEGIQTLAQIGIVNATEAEKFFLSTIETPPPSNLATWVVWHLINFESWSRNHNYL